MAKLKAWYKKHTRMGRSKARMLVVVCPKAGAVRAVAATCCGGLEYSPKGGRGARAVTQPCEFYDGSGIGCIICNHPKAGGDASE